MQRSLSLSDGNCFLHRGFVPCNPRIPYFGEKYKHVTCGSSSPSLQNSINVHSFGIGTTWEVLINTDFIMHHQSSPSYTRRASLSHHINYAHPRAGSMYGHNNGCCGIQSATIQDKQIDLLN